MVGNRRGIKISNLTREAGHSEGFLRTIYEQDLSTLRAIRERGHAPSSPSSTFFPSPFFLDVLDSTFFSSSPSFSGINQDKCLGNIVGQRLAGTGNGSLWSDTDMYFVWLGEFFFFDRSRPHNSF